MKLLWTACTALILASCSIFPLSWKTPVLDGLQLKNIRSVYLVTEIGLLSSHALEDSPEILVVHSFRDFQTVPAQSRVALWIDKDALQLVDSNWLHQEPQKYCPLLVLGYNQPLFVFREKLSGFGIEGPGISWDTKRLEPGYSVWMLKEEGDTFMQGYSREPTVEELQLVTNSLLDGKTWK